MSAQVVEGVADRGVGLHQRTLQFGGELLVVQAGEERVDLGGGAPRREVDDVELLLDPYPELACAHGRDGR